MKRKNRNRGDYRKSHTAGYIIAAIQALVSLFFLGFLLVLNILPWKYTGIIGVVLLLIWAFTFFSQKHERLHAVGKVIAILMILLLLAGGYYMAATRSFMKNITGNEVQTTNIIVAVKTEDLAESLQDAADYDFGIMEVLDRDRVNDTITEIEKELEQSIHIKEYGSLRDIVNALEDGEIQSMIYNSAWDSSIDEIEEDYTKTIRVLKLVEVETPAEDITSEKEVDREPFIIYIGGLDEYGKITAAGRHDVNILMVVNPDTKQILLAVTPRDYYVAFPGITGENKDKLTHAGNFGVGTSMSTLQQVYDVEIDHYVKVNFTSFVHIVDALGGIEAYSAQAFTTRNGKYAFIQGFNEMNGEQALAFSRERYNVQGGDFQRGKNQLAVLTAMLQKAASPAILTSYLSILEGLEDQIDTSLTSSQIASLVKMQLNDNRDWSISSVAAGGTTSSEYCHSLGTRASVVIPDQTSIDEISDLIARVLSGEMVDVSVGE